MPNAVLLLGAGGFIGRHLVDRLSSMGRPVLAVGRGAAPDGLASEVIWKTKSLSTPRDYRPLLDQCSQVIHLVSGSTPGSTTGRPIDELHQNLIPTFSLLEALQDHSDHKLIFLSTGGAIYGNPTQSPVSETSPIQPRSYYAAGKAASEHFIHACSMQFKLRATILRPPNLYGPGQYTRSGFGIVPTAFSSLLNNKPMTIWGAGQVVRDYLYIDDFTTLCVQILSQRMPEGCHIYNAGTGVGISVTQLLDIIEEVTGRTLTRKYEPYRQVDVQRIVLDASAAKRIFDWQATTPLHTGLKRSWEWFKNNNR